MVRRSVWWRVNFGADTIGERFTPKRWLMDYCLPKELMDMVEGGMDRRKLLIASANPTKKILAVTLTVFFCVLVSSFKYHS